MAKHSRYSGHASKADKIRAHISKHSAAYEKHLRAAAKDVPEPGADGHAEAWQGATQAAQQGAAADTAEPMAPGLPPGVPPPQPAQAA